MTSERRKPLDFENKPLADWEKELLGIRPNTPDEDEILPNPAEPEPSLYEYTRLYYPFGPAPEGWERIQFCSRNLPHNEGDWDQNIELNAGHYPEYVGDLMMETLRTARAEIRKTWDY